MLARFLGLASFVLFAPAALAQGAAEHIALGDREAAALNASGALAHYEQAVAADSQNYEALWKAAREAVGLGEFERDDAKRKELFAKGEQYARKAVEVNPSDPEGHFNLARALGRVALSLGTRDRIRYAGVIREHALKALELNPQHPGALHVMGVWNAEVMRLNAFSRAIAKTFLGGKVFGEASWENAVRYMEQAVAVDPERLTHHLDLGRIYADRDEKAKAREALERVVNGTPTEYNDQFYKQEAQRALERIK